jgi:hypothetical protein
MTCPVGEHGGDPSWANWNTGGAWISTHLWEHYTFSMDKDYLREVYPVLKGAADFCLGWLVEKDGYLLTAPATSPENIYRTPDGYDDKTIAKLLPYRIGKNGLTSIACCSTISPPTSTKARDDAGVEAPIRTCSTHTHLSRLTETSVVAPV